MKKTQTKLEQYSTGVEKALRRSAQRAESIAATTGTRLIVYEKGHITHLPPRIKSEGHKMIPNPQLDSIGKSPGHPLMKTGRLQKTKANPAAQRPKEHEKAVAEKRARYGGG